MPLLRPNITNLSFDLRRISELAQSHPECIRSDLGELDYPIPESFRNLMKNQSLTEEFNYAPTLGLPSLVEAVEYFEKPLLSHFTNPQVLITSGGQAGLFAALSTILSKGDQVLTDQLYYPPYSGMSQILEAKLINTDLNKISSVDPRAKVLVITTPNNPTGKIYNREELKKLAKIAQKNNLLILEDRVYDRIYQDQEPPSIAEFAPERTLIINSASKNFCMPGMRIGWVLGESELILQTAKIHRNMNSCPNSFFQQVLADFLPHSQTFLTSLREEMNKRHHLLSEGLIALGWKILPNNGAIYLVAEGPEVIDIDQWITRKGVSAIPGPLFGGNDRMLRFCYGTLTPNKIKEFLKRIS